MFNITLDTVTLKTAVTLLILAACMVRLAPDVTVSFCWLW